MTHELLGKESSYKGDLASGTRVPLLIPPCLIREWHVNGVTGDYRAMLEKEHGSALGYEFEWGQIVEERFGDWPDDDLADRPISWEFLLSGLHDEFLDAGGYLEELSDVALRFLDDLVAAPDFIEFDEGSDICAFEVIVHGDRNARAARAWLSGHFVPNILPMIIARIRRLHLVVQERVAAEQKLH